MLYPRRFQSESGKTQQALKKYAMTGGMRPPRTITPIVPSFARPPPLIVSPFYAKATIDLKQEMEPVFFASNRFDILQILTGIH